MPEYRRNLPHFHPEGACLFLTWRLCGSMPSNLDLVRHASPAQAFLAEDRILGRSPTGPHWLNDPRVANVVSDAIRRGDSERRFYDLVAWVVMPNHVHILIYLLVPVPTFMRWVKGSTARSANKILGRTSQRLWQDESYDHYLRKNDRLDKTIAYIERNPVKAGLVGSAVQWRWSSASRQAETPVLPLRN
jgi:putative transposase